MTNVISFPGLFEKSFEINEVAFTAFGFPVAWYGVILASGFLLAAFYCFARSKRVGLTADNLIDMLLWALPISIVGARAYYVLHMLDYYKANPDEIFKIWHGGIAIYGAVIAAVITVFVFCRVKKLDTFSMLDIGALGLLIGQLIGRWANFVNGEAFGGVTDVIWGMSINGGAPVHPTFFYESMWNLIGFIFLHFYLNRRKFRGEIFLMYVSWYGLGRAWIEGMRTDSLYISNTGIRVSQAFAVFTFVAATALLFYFYISKKYPAPFKAQQKEIEDGNKD